MPGRLLADAALPREDQDHGLRRDHDDVSVSDYDHVGDHDYDHEISDAGHPELHLVVASAIAPLGK